MKVKRDYLLSAKDCFAIFMAIGKSKLPDDEKAKLQEKILGLTDIKRSRIGAPKKAVSSTRDVRRAEIVDCFIEDGTADSVADALFVIRGLHDMMKALHEHGYLAGTDFDPSSPDPFAELFPEIDLASSISRGRKIIRNTNCD